MVERPDQAVPIEFRRFACRLPRGNRKLFARQPLVPQVVEQHGAQFPFGRRPLAVGLANRDVNLEHQRAVQVVHQLHEVAARLRDQLWVLLRTELAAGHIEFATLIENRAKERRRIGVVAAGHRSDYSVFRINRRMRA